MKNKELNHFKSIFIIGPMDLNSKELLSNPQSDSTLIIYVDGGYKHLPNIKGINANVPYLLVGDNDSAEVNDEEFNFLLNTNKDFTDLSYTIDHLKANYSSETQLFFDGFDGGRFDHQYISLMNISRCGFPAVFYPKQGYFIISNKKETTLDIKGLFSIILFEDTEINIKGECEYELDSSVISSFNGHLLSNNGHGKIKINHNKTIGVYIHEY